MWVNACIIWGILIFFVIENEILFHVDEVREKKSTFQFPLLQLQRSIHVDNNLFTINKLIANKLLNDMHCSNIIYLLNINYYFLWWRPQECPYL